MIKSEVSPSKKKKLVVRSFRCKDESGERVHTIDRSKTYDYSKADQGIITVFSGDRFSQYLNVVFLSGVVEE